MIAPIDKIPQVTEDKIVMEYLEGATVYELHCRHFPVSRPKIVRLLKDRQVMRNTTRKTDPSPEEIAERAREIREGWTEEEAMRRWVGRAGVSFQSSLVGDK